MSAAAIAVPAVVVPITTDVRQQRARQHDRVLADRTLHPNAKTLYTVLRRRCWMADECQDSIEYLADRTGMGESTLRRHAKTLRSRGHIDWVPTGRQNRWFIPTASEQSVCPKAERSECSPVDTQNAQDIGMPCARAPVFVETYIDKVETTTPASPVIEEPKIVSSHEAEKIKTALIERNVAPREARKLAQSVPPTEAERSIAAADDYVRKQENIKNQAGLYVAAVRERWKPAGPPPRSVPVIAASLPTCSVCAAEMRPYETLVVGDAGLMHGRCGGER